MHSNNIDFWPRYHGGIDSVYLPTTWRVGRDSFAGVGIQKIDLDQTHSEYLAISTVALIDTEHIKHSVELVLLHVLKTSARPRFSRSPSFPPCGLTK